MPCNSSQCNNLTIKNDFTVEREILTAAGNNRMNRDTESSEQAKETKKIEKKILTNIIYSQPQVTC